MITIYTDGSSRGNPGPGGWAAIIMLDDSSKSQITNSKSQIVEIGGREDHTTNNKMELTATIKALENISNAEQIELNTDSEYVMKGITLWVHNWQKKGWKTAAKKPVLNQELWQELLAVTEGKEITWKYVPGHAGVPLNERADVIATTFADNMKIDLYDGPASKYPYK